MGSKKKVQVVSFQSLSANSGAGMARLGYLLSKELHKRGVLKNFIIHSKGKFKTPFPSFPVSVLSRYYLFALNKIFTILAIPSHKFRYLQERLFDFFCSMRLSKDTGILFTTNAFLHGTFRKAKKMGIIIVLLPGTPEENYICGLVLEENKKMGIVNTDAYTYKRRINYFNKSIPYIDTVIGSFPTVYTSYSNSTSYNGNIVKMLGHMTPDFKPAILADKTANTNAYKVGYIAHTVVLKGLHYLLEAWQDLMQDADNHKMQLHIAGNLDPAMNQYVNTHFSNIRNVYMKGHVTDVPAFLSTLDLFVVPSLIDGEPATALEAAHHAIPVIITENCGASELLSRNNSGCWIIPIRDKDAIKEKIKWAYAHPAESKQVGLNTKYNLDNYNMEAFINNIADYLENEA